MTHRQRFIAGMVPSADSSIEDRLAWLFLQLADNAGALTNRSKWTNVVGLTDSEVEVALATLDDLD